MVSFYHFDRMNQVQPEPGEWSNYFQRFLDGQMLYGSWYDHVGNWWNKTKTYPKLHYMFYEDIAEVIYLVEPLPEDKKTIVELVHFDNMKNNEMTNCSKRPFFDFSISQFMRKGKVGDWKTHFTVAQNEAFDEDYRSKMKDPTLRFRTEI
uniref:Sulfotransferase n=1 Tax=Xiphophorus couchianus TaxID=32473 RepID=A0A3B5MK79_9TELE